MASIGPFPSSSTASFANLSTASLPSSTATSSSSSSTVSSSSSQSCVVPISISGILAERIAQNVLAEMRNKCRCAYDILPQIWSIEDLSLTNANLNEYYKKHGPQFLSYLQYYTRLELIEDIKNKVLSTWEATDQLRDATSGLYAIANFGIGEKEELATYAAAECALQDVPVIRITAVSRPVFVAKGKILPIKEHTFLLLGVEHSEFERLRGERGDRIHTILKGLHGVLLDPYLNLICPLNRMATLKEGQDFLRYMSLRNIEFVGNTFTRNKEQWQAIKNEGEKIYSLIQQLIPQRVKRKNFLMKLLMKLLTKPEKLELLTEAEKEIRSKVMLETETELKRIFPELEWKMSLEEGKIWIEGSFEQVSRACASVNQVNQAYRILRENEIQTEVVEKPKTEVVAKPKKSKKPEPVVYQCFVKNLDLMRLRLLNSTPSAEIHIPVQTSVRHAPFYTPTAALTSCPLPCLLPPPYIRPPRPSTSFTPPLHRQASVLAITSSHALDSTPSLPSQTTTSSQIVESTSSLPPVRTTTSSRTPSSTVSLPPQTTTSSQVVESTSSLPYVRANAPSRTPGLTVSLPSQTTSSSQTVESTSSLSYVRTTASSRAPGSMVSLPPLALSSHGSVSNLTLPRLVTGNVPAATGNEGKESRQ